MADELAALFIHGYPEGRQRGQNHLTHKQQRHWFHALRATEERLQKQPYFFKDDGLLVPHGVDGVALGRLCLESFSSRVDGESKHVKLHINAHLFVSQKLSWYDLKRHRDINDILSKHITSAQKASLTIYQEHRFHLDKTGDNRHLTVWSKLLL